jgi:hypothetical protein
LDVVHQLAGGIIENQSTRWDPDQKIRGVAAVTLLPTARFPVGREKLALEAKVVQGGQAAFGNEENRPANPTITAIGAALGLSLFAPEGNGTGTAMATTDANCCSIDKHKAC